MPKKKPKRPRRSAAATRTSKGDGLDAWRKRDRQLVYTWMAADRALTRGLLFTNGKATKRVKALDRRRDKAEAELAEHRRKHPHALPDREPWPIARMRTSRTMEGAPLRFPRQRPKRLSMHDHLRARLRLLVAGLEDVRKQAAAAGLSFSGRLRYRLKGMA